MPDRRSTNAAGDEGADRHGLSHRVQRIARLGGWQLDLATNALEWSNEMFRLYDVPRGNATAAPQDCLASVLPDDLPLTEQAYLQALSDHTPIDFVHRVRQSDGAIRHIRVRGEAAYSDDGAPVRAYGTAQDVTEELLRSQALQESESRLQGIFAAMSEGLVIHAADGRIVDANPAASEILGLSRDELMGLKSIDPRWRAVLADGTRFPGRDHPAMLTLRTGAIIRGQIMGIHDPKRGLRWLSINSNPVFGADRTQMQGAVATFVDVTASRQRDADMARIAAELEDLYENAPCGYHTIDANGVITSVNATELRWLGLARSEVVGRPASEFMSPESRDRLGQNLAQLKKRGRMDGVEYDYGSPLGPKRRVRVHASVQVDDDGKFLKSRSVLTDVTDLHHAREQLQQILSEQIAITDSEMIGIVKVRERRIVWANPGMKRIFGYSPSEIEGLPTRILYASDDSDRRVGEAIGHAQPDGSVGRFQLEMVRKNGDAVWIDMSSVSLSAESAEWMGLLVDITPVRQAQDKQLQITDLEAENRQIAEMNRLKSAFLANMSHELRTPLNAVIGFSDLLRRGVVAPASAKFTTYLDRIDASGKHLRQLIDTMLEVAKSDSETVQFHPEHVDLARLIQDVIAMLTAKSEERRISIALELGSEFGPIFVDPLRLRQVLLNLIGNATKFSHDGGHVRVRAALSDPTHFTVEVEDHGIGIAASDLPRLFTRFTQLNAGATRPYAGMGLGLAIVCQLVELQGGTVGVRSALGLGSVFHLTLPLSPQVQ